MPVQQPLGPKWVPNLPDYEPSGDDAPFNVSKWNADVPLLLVPVRIETKFETTNGVDELRIRLLPDPATVHDAAPASAAELAEAYDFWVRYHETSGADRDQVWRRFVQRLGSHRVGYVARLTKPAVSGDGNLTYPEVDPDQPQPGFASLLPHRWMATGWVDDTLAFQEMGKEIARPLFTSPDPSAPTWKAADSGLVIDDATTWLFDYERAVEVGMAITVPLTDKAAIANKRVSTLIVLGLDESQTPTTASDELTALLEQHSQASGLAFVPQGTPTNNTDTVDAGYRRMEREMADLAARELDAASPDEDDNASRLSSALGLDATELLLRTAHGADREHAESRDMRIALFETVFGTYVRQLLATNAKGSDGLGAGLDGDTVTALRVWFEEWVTGGAPVPTVRIGRQPYGILPVMAATGATHTGETETTIAAAVAVLIEEWRAALALVPSLDHNATDSLSSDVEARETVTAVLANNPHPRRLAVRTASDWSDQPPAVATPPQLQRGNQTTTDVLEGFDRVLREASGGFRFEFDEAISALNDRYATSLKGLYYEVLQEVVPPGRVILDPTGQDPTNPGTIGSGPTRDDPAVPGTGGTGTKGPGTKGPGTSGLGTKGPGSRGPDSKGPGTKRPDSKGPGSRGPDAKASGRMRPGTKGPGSRRPDTTGLDEDRRQLRSSAIEGHVPEYLPRGEEHIRGIEEQLEIWIQMESEIDKQGAITIEFAEFLGEFHDYALDVIEQLERHELRQRPLRWLDVPGLDGVLGRDDLQLLLTRFSTLDRLWQRTTIIDEALPGDVSAARYLNHLATRLGDLVRDPPTPGRDEPLIDIPVFDILHPDFLAEAPLLFQMLGSTLYQGDNRLARSEAIARLAAVEPDRLDWLLRETLGLGSNRLDAWHTSLATERLASMRTRQPAGSYIGAYGFVLDLDRSSGRTSNGFLHAPSLPHAASAAVLRSGWLARGSEDNESPAAVDLASSRVREADWLLSGVRNGQDIGELVGARFERALHDAFLDLAIRPLRLAVAEADGLGEAAGDVPVDGLRLLDLYRGRDPSDPNELEVAIDGLALSTQQEHTLSGLLRSIESGFDAIDDATTFEAVHQLVVGNLDRAAAVTDSMGPVGGRPPELLGVRTPRDALTIDTRSLVLIDAASSAESTTWAKGTRDRFDPALNAWVAALLPAPDEVGWTATAADGTTVEVTLSNLALSALDACCLTSDDPLAVTPALRRLSEVAEQTAFSYLDPAEAGSAPISLAEFQLLAVELKRLIQEATVADGHALAAAELAIADAVIGVEAVERAELELVVTRKVFDRIVLLDRWEDVTDSDLEALARVGLVQRANTDPVADFEMLRSRIERRMNAHDAVDDPDSIEGMRRRTTCIVGMTVPLLVAFAMPDETGVQLHQDLASADVIDDWFDTVATVRPSLGEVGRVMNLGALLGTAPPSLAAGQYPLIEGDQWAAVARPAPGTGGRIAVAAVTHGELATGSAVVGLVLDQWSERIPGNDQVTGVTFHFDGPSTEAPQTMLLAVPPENGAWSTSLVLDTILETIEWAQLRTVAIDDLGDFGHAIPTTYVPGELSNHVVEGATS